LQDCNLINQELEKLELLLNGADLAQKQQGQQQQQQQVSFAGAERLLQTQGSSAGGEWHAGTKQGRI
jgi:hypothetical protein